MASKQPKKVKETPSKLELSEKVLEADKVKEADKQKVFILLWLDYRL